jgi:hypothetical protein
MLNYADEHGRLPPAVVYGRDGKALYSWRVLLLPYLEEQDLHRQFHLDEPWDSDHNSQLIDRMPALYAPPGSKKKLVLPGYTFCHLFVGGGTAFEDPRGQLLKDLTRGTSNTLLIIEAGEPVPWTKPEELVYVPGQPLASLPGPFRDIFRLTLADGSRRHLDRDTDEAELRELIAGEQAPGEVSQRITVP